MPTGIESPAAPVVPPTYAPFPGLDEVDLLGDTVGVGNTWHDVQHNGGCGRTIVHDAADWDQVVWTNGEAVGSTVRHVWWNALNPIQIPVFSIGVVCESTIRAGYCVIDADAANRAFVAYHQWPYSGANPNPAVAVDLFPHYGAFLEFVTPTIPNVSLCWPKMQVGPGERVHLVAAENVPSAGMAQSLQYISGVFNPQNFTMTWSPSWTFVDCTRTLGQEVGVSSASGRLGIAWMKYLSESQINNDVWLLLDEDGLNPNFSQAVNLTNFSPLDTLRAYTDASVFFDQNNYCHVAFTTRAYFDSIGSSYWNASIIWHWSEQWPDSFRMIADFFDPSDWVDCGAWNVKAQRPSLGQDPATGHLYCMYQVYDTDSLHLSAYGWPSGEVYVSKSTDGGMNWSLGTNVTNTITPQQAPAGQCKSEEDPSMAKLVDGECRIFYMFDYDAGSTIQTQGQWTHNRMRYHHVPVGLIPATPLVPQNKHLHVTPPPQLDVTLTPYLPPPPYISFNFQASVVNHGPSQTPFSVWARIKFPNGTWSDPTLGPVQINPPVGIVVSRLRYQSIPGTWPAGFYQYVGYANSTYSYPPLDSSWFYFEKWAGGNASTPFDPAPYCTGELFPGEIPAVSSEISDFKLMGVNPNPFNPTTTISYQLSEISKVTLRVFDTAGRLVETLVNESQEAGSHQATFDGSNLASGLYLYTLTAGPNTTAGKMILLK
jgi:hypothetical protein